jgi:hypothetical protein
MENLIAFMVVVCAIFFFFLMKATEERKVDQMKMKKKGLSSFSDGQEDDVICDPAYSFLSCNIFHEDHYEK